MANKTVLKKEKKNLNLRRSRYLTSGNARAYLFIHLSKPTDFNEIRVLRQENIFIFGKQ